MPIAGANVQIYPQMNWIPQDDNTKNAVYIYQRPAYLAEDDKTNDDFTYDFLQNIECDDLIQLLTTSPFMSVSDVTSFVNKF